MLTEHSTKPKDPAKIKSALNLIKIPAFKVKVINLTIEILFVKLFKKL